MKKILALTLAAIMVLALLAGCGKTTPTEPEEPEVAEEVAEEVVVDEPETEEVEEVVEETEEPDDVNETVVKVEDEEDDKEKAHINLPGKVDDAMVGTYTLSYMEGEDEEDSVSAEDIQMLNDLGLVCKLLLDADGEGTLVLFGEPVEIRWTDKAIEVDGEKVDIVLDGDSLSLTDGDSSMIFEKTSDEVESVDDLAVDYEAMFSDEDFWTEFAESFELEEGEGALESDIAEIEDATND